MKITHHAAAQNSPEWKQARLGVITASVAAKLLTASLAVANNETSSKLCRTLAVERATGMKEPEKSNRNFERGHELEPMAKQYYADKIQAVTDCGLFVAEVSPGLFIGASPDGLVGDEGLIEIKCLDFSLHAEVILTQEFPKIYRPQIQTQLLVTRRKWVDFVSFCPGLPLFVKRVFPDYDLQGVLVAAFHSAEKSIDETVARFLSASAGLIPTEQLQDEEIEITPTIHT